MAQYRKIEYHIRTDGKVIEKVLNATGTDCTLTTTEIEEALGKVVSRELLPEYYSDPDSMMVVEDQSVYRG